jgi:hypothetical protein
VVHQVTVDRQDHRVQTLELHAGIGPKLGAEEHKLNPFAILKEDSNPSRMVLPAVFGDSLILGEIR